MVVQEIDSDGFRSLARIFTPSNFKKIVRKKDCHFTSWSIERYFKLPDTSVVSLKNYELIQSLYRELQKNYKSEYFYKNLLLNKELLKRYSLKTTTVLNEFKIGNSIADFTLLNGEAKIFEIKTDLDGLDKLRKQIADYIQFANKVYIVTSPKFSQRVLSDYCGSTVGILELSARNSIKEIKEAGDNAKHFNHTTIFKTLRKPEYLQLINSYFGYVPNVPNTRIFKECFLMALDIPILDFQKLAFNLLKKRKLKCPDLLLLKTTPYELKHICYTLDLSRQEYQNLHEFLNQEI